MIEILGFRYGVIVNNFVHSNGTRVFAEFVGSKLFRCEDTARVQSIFDLFVFSDNNKCLGGFVH